MGVDAHQSTPAPVACTSHMAPLPQPSQPDESIGAVVVGWDPLFTYSKLVYASCCLRELPGCVFVATNTDHADKIGGANPGRMMPGTGCLVAALETATGQRAVRGAGCVGAQRQGVVVLGGVTMGDSWSCHYLRDAGMLNLKYGWRLRAGCTCMRCFRASHVACSQCAKQGLSHALPCCMRRSM